MKLVVVTSSGDGWTFTCENVRPVEYESAEALLVELEEAAKKHQATSTSTFKFAGFEWSLDEFGAQERVDKPTRPKAKERPEHRWVWHWEDVEVLTIDEWFAKHGGKS